MPTECKEIERERERMNGGKAFMWENDGTGHATPQALTWVWTYVGLSENEVMHQSLWSSWSAPAGTYLSFQLLGFILGLLYSHKQLEKHNGDVAERRFEFNPACCTTDTWRFHAPICPKSPNMTLLMKNRHLTKCSCFCFKFFVATNDWSLE